MFCWLFEKKSLQRFDTIGNDVGLEMISITWMLEGNLHCSRIRKKN